MLPQKPLIAEAPEIGTTVSPMKFIYEQSRNCGNSFVQERLIAHRAKRLIMVGGRIVRLGQHTSMFICGGREARIAA